MNYYTIPKLKDAVATYKYRTSEIVDSEGEKPIPGQQIKETPAKWIDRALKPFSLRPNVKGIYYVRFFSDTTKKTKPDVYPIVIGMTVKEAEAFGQQQPPPTVIHVTTPEPKPQKGLSEMHPLTWESALDYQKQIADLRGKVRELEMENAILKNENAELKDEQQETLSEQKTTDFWTSIIPVADNFFSDRKQQRAIQFMQAANQNPGLWQYQHLFMPGMAPQQQPQFAPPVQQQKPAPSGMLEKAQKFIDDQQDEVYAQIEKVKEKSKDINDFFIQLSKELPDVYQAMYTYVNS